MTVDAAADAGGATSIAPFLPSFLPLCDRSQICIAVRAPEVFLVVAGRGGEEVRAAGARSNGNENSGLRPVGASPPAASAADEDASVALFPCRLTICYV